MTDHPIEQQDQRPAIALMGEFSAGKSTLANLLLGEGEGRSPVRVTATQLPPVWFSFGTDAPYAVDLDGNETPVSLDALEEIPVEETQCIRIFLETDILEVMDLIDMPGNSDPNMSADVWKRMLHHADGVIWCTHANQAWRQSEAAVWEEMHDALQRNSILLLTRFDKILGDTNRLRVLKRVKAEAGAMFAGVYPVSLTEALDSGDDRAKWEASGAEAFLQALLDIVINGRFGGEPEPDIAPAEAHPEPGPAILPRRVARAAGEAHARRPVA